MQQIETGEIYTYDTTYLIIGAYISGKVIFTDTLDKYSLMRLLSYVAIPLSYEGQTRIKPLIQNSEYVILDIDDLYCYDYVRTVNMNRYKVDVLKRQMLGTLPKEMKTVEESLSIVNQVAKQYLSDVIHYFKDIKIGTIFKKLNQKYIFLGFDEYGCILFLFKYYSSVFSYEQVIEQMQKTNVIADKKEYITVLSRLHVLTLEELLNNNASV